jgi:subtilisin family serine protease
MGTKFVKVVCAVALAVGAAGVGAGQSVSGAPAATIDSSAAIVQLTGAPLSVAAATKPTNGKKIDFNSTTTKSERAKLSAIRNSFRKWLSDNKIPAKINKEFDISLNAVSVSLNGATLAQLRAAPMVVAAELQGIFRPLAHDDPDLSLVHAAEAWANAGGEANAGAGVKVAIIDSGIDVNHPCFDDTGYAAQTQVGPADLTNNKVIVAKVYSNRIRQDNLDPTAVDGHGTHVAGTVACNAHTPAAISGVDIPYDPSGVAPRALLGNYNVFPGETGSARSEDILQAMEDAYADGFDVANMSLGGARNDGGGAFLLDNAIDNLDRANMVIAVAAGNEGPGYWTVHYPGAAPRALTAGASTVGHALINIVTVGGVDYEAVVGDFAPVTTDLTAPLQVVPEPGNGFDHGLAIACDDSPELPNLAGHIALLGRGTCDFTVKVRNAQNHGAVGVIMVDRVQEAPFFMSHNGLEPRPTIPAVMVSLSDGLVIAAHDGENVTLQAQPEYITRPNDTNLVAGFSSWGPTHGDVLIKPDVVAPGADIISSLPEADCDPLPPEGCWGFLGGTSMATPHLAGAAAVVRGLHPDWSAAQVRSSIVNTAQEGLLRNPLTDKVTADAMIVGTGLLDVAAATEATAALDPVSKSFGSVPSGSGKSLSATIVITNIGAVASSFTASVVDSDADGAAFTGSAAFSLAPGQSRSVTVSVALDKGAADGHKQAVLRVSSGGVEVAHGMLFALVGSGEAAPGQHMVPVPKA